MWPPIGEAERKMWNKYFRLKLRVDDQLEVCVRRTWQRISNKVAIRSVMRASTNCLGLVIETGCSVMLDSPSQNLHASSPVKCKQFQTLITFLNQMRSYLWNPFCIFRRELGPSHLPSAPPRQKMTYLEPIFVESAPLIFFVGSTSKKYDLLRFHVKALCSIVISFGTVSGKYD